jgi:transposase
VFTLHGVDGAGRAVLRRNLRRRELLSFFERLPSVEVALEACGGSHHWARALLALGHRVRLIPPQYVKPFVKRSKNDRNDAEAISVAAAQPSIGSVAVKSAEQQAAAMLLSVRELLVRQRTQRDARPCRRDGRGRATRREGAERAAGRGSPQRMTQRCRRRQSRPWHCSAGKWTASRRGGVSSTPRCCNGTRPIPLAGGFPPYRGLGRSGR